MRRARAGRRILVAAAAIAVTWASAAAAQTPASTTQPQARQGSQTEFDVGLAFLPPVPMGTANVNFITGSGSAFAVANTSNRTGASFGLEARIGLRERERLSFEMAGAWSHVRFQTVVISDVEAAAATATIGVSRFTVGGHAVFKVAMRGRHDIYTLAGASWMREVGQISTGGLYADGAIVDGGAGLKLWLREQGKGKVKRVGLRIEGRVGVRTGGLQLDNKSAHFTSAFVGSLVIGS